MTHLILGGARSGKSRHAESLALASGLSVVYLATGWAGDEEMAARIAKHCADRPADWLTVEEPCALAAALQTHAAKGRFVIVDCLTLWLSNLLAGEETRFQAERAALLDSLPGLPGTVCLVSNEVGQGIVPVNPLARRFVDEAGWLHQDLARLCERVVWVVAGLPQLLKNSQ
jgi:adenosylcobinamide kinase/adenosylcobinamide-phosphate guanylyltransferase